MRKFRAFRMALDPELLSGIVQGPVHWQHAGHDMSTAWVPRDEVTLSLHLCI